MAYDVTSSCDRRDLSAVRRRPVPSFHLFQWLGSVNAHSVQRELGRSIWTQAPKSIWTRNAGPNPFRWVEKKLCRAWSVAVSLPEVARLTKAINKVTGISAVCYRFIFFIFQNQHGYTHLNPPKNRSRTATNSLSPSCNLIIKLFLLRLPNNESDFNSGEALAEAPESGMHHHQIVHWNRVLVIAF